MHTNTSSWEGINYFTAIDCLFQGASFTRPYVILLTTKYFGGLDADLGNYGIYNFGRGRYGQLIEHCVQPCHPPAFGDWVRRHISVPL